MVFTSADFDAGTSTSVAVAERDEAVEEAAEEAAEASTPEPVAEQAAEPVASTPSPSPAAAAPKAPTPEPEDSLLSSVLAAFGDRRAIETINGRVAMLGFVDAISAEQATHATLIEQLPAAFGSVALITLASLAPKLRANPIAPRDGITEDAGVLRGSAQRRPSGSMAARRWWASPPGRSSRRSPAPRRSRSSARGVRDKRRVKRERV